MWKSFLLTQWNTQWNAPMKYWEALKHEIFTSDCLTLNIMLTAKMRTSCKFKCLTCLAWNKLNVCKTNHNANSVLFLMDNVIIVIFNFFLGISYSLLKFLFIWKAERQKEDFPCAGHFSNVSTARRSEELGTQHKSPMW